MIYIFLRWNFVVHGCIDGFSRLITVLKVSSDNEAITALNYFVEGIKEYGVPSRLRMDKGSEFVHIRSLMDTLNGSNRGSHISGRSVHNQRIERLWRDVFLKVLQKFYKIFYHMEDHGIFEIGNPIHLFALHHTFLKRIDCDLKHWCSTHNGHRIRTERHKTPMQLWISSSIQNSYALTGTAMHNLFSREDVSTSVNEFYQTRELVEPTDISIVLPRVEPPLTVSELNALNQRVDVLRDSESHGVDIYIEVLTFIQHAMQ